ncbi:nickel-responsive transcriptional regulator NikR [Desulfomonile tiedjei]|uniref:Putative nickel-responsive regulator n=1 Tax=Desulfomonile tiedjei (strain ATCC 49306 / DSM 6799 / DCB-1) TaxID=706587 RepID=I4C7J6_DESTA|nr:nickel-responsive transcriptional regulator NikR [Desulfomonile tiedjei]AFM25537.1 putative transcriptional regulator with CopG/Arc/MetJ DNA-binding domain and metal-binding domain [Desulfomonile tiedjei DSM 6799]
MADLVRFGVSIPDDLLERFDELISNKGYTNRSEAIRDLIRDRLVDHEWSQSTHDVVGTVTVVYNHEQSDLAQKLTEIQHTKHDLIVSAVHVHLDQHNCLEVLIMRGGSEEVRKAGEQLISTRGVKHGKITMTTTGKELD